MKSIDCCNRLRGLLFLLLAPSCTPDPPPSEPVSLPEALETAEIVVNVDGLEVRDGEARVVVGSVTHVGSREVVSVQLVFEVIRGAEVLGEISGGVTPLSTSREWPFGIVVPSLMAPEFTAIGDPRVTVVFAP